MKYFCLIMKFLLQPTRRKLTFNSSGCLKLRTDLSSSLCSVSKTFSSFNKFNILSRKSSDSLFIFSTISCRVFLHSTTTLNWKCFKANEDVKKKNISIYRSLSYHDVSHFLSLFIQIQLYLLAHISGIEQSVENLLRFKLPYFSDILFRFICFLSTCFYKFRERKSQFTFYWSYRQLECLSYY